MQKLTGLKLGGNGSWEYWALTDKNISAEREISR
jgi:hypothetical protein